MNTNMDPMSPDQGYYYDPIYMTDTMAPMSQNNLHPPPPSSMHYMGGMPQSPMNNSSMLPHGSHPGPYQTHPMSHPMNSMATNQMLSPQPPPPASMNDSGSNNQMSLYGKPPPLPPPSPLQMFDSSNHGQASAYHSQSYHGAIPSYSKSKPYSSAENSINVSGTLTHVSETDNSREHLVHTAQHHPGYPQTPPMPIQNKPLSNHTTSTPINYGQMAPISGANWNSHFSNSSVSSVPHSSRISQTSTHTTSLNQTPVQNGKSAHYSAFSNARNADYHSQHRQQPPTNGQATPIVQTQVKEPQKNRLEKTFAQISQEKHNELLKSNVAGATKEDGGAKSQQLTTTTTTTNIHHNQNSNNKNNNKDITHSNSSLVEKRQITVFKVIEQFIDPSSKAILKENVVQNVEHITLCGQVHFDTLSHETSLLSTNGPHSTRSSAVFADVSALSVASVKSNIDSVDVSVDEKVNTPKSVQSSTIEDSPKIDSPVKTEAKTVAPVESPNKPLKENGPSQETNPKSEKKKKVKETVPLSKEIEPETVPKPVVPSKGKSQDSNVETLVVDRMRPGIKVLAKWKDKNFYPAEVFKQLANNKWSVKFEDSQTKNLFENEVVRLEYLTPTQEIMLSIGDDACVKATIKKIYSKNIKSLEFDLEHFENGKSVTKRYRLKDIFLSGDQGVTILNRTGHKRIVSKINSESVFADVDLDNIVSGKRSRSNKAEVTSKKSASIASQSSSECSDVPVVKKKRVEEKKNGSGGGGAGGSTVPKPENNEDKQLGTVVESKIFQKCSFLFVSKDDLFLAEGSESSSSDQLLLSAKEHLVKQVIAGHGKVFESFEEMKEKTHLKNCYLISKSYNSSVKYFQCLSSGVPIVSHLWIVESCRSNKLLDRSSFALSSGYSIIERKPITESSTIQKASGLFKGIKIFCIFQDLNNCDSLNQILDASEVTRVSTLKDDKIDLIVSDSSTSPKELVKHANETKIPLVTREYILQCLINGRKLPHDSSPTFKPKSHTPSQ